ncbi:MAG: hypothetical protein A2176_07110 [Spirochaetes bacterium RBG_13_51_14]|nr:MAG: hypothetical protein A2176_07110 [Spirochaetes bacterium RBG_13_51_14]
MKDRRKSPRIKFAMSKPGFSVRLILKRFFFKDREIECRLRDISEGGASLLVSKEYKKYVHEKCVGTSARLVSENAELSFQLLRKGRVMRVIDRDNELTVVVQFTSPA